MSPGARCAIAAALGVLIGGCAGNGQPVSGPTTPRSTASATAGSIYVAADVERMASDVGVDVRRIAAETIERVERQLPGAPAQVTIRSDPDGRTGLVVPETGVGGRVRWPSRQIELVVDTSFQEDASRLFETWLPRVLAHELHHHRRYAAVDRPVHSLLDNLVTDGLAIAFASEVLPDAPPAPWADALTPEQEAHWWEVAQPHLAHEFTQDDFARWFFGRGDIPRWTGYTLGAKLVDAYLRQSGTTAAAAVDIGARQLLRASPYSP